MGFAVFAGLFSSDKAPFILTVTLAIISWFISNILANISDVTVIGIRTTTRGQNVVYELANYSLKASVQDAYFRFKCAAGNKNCLQPVFEGGGKKLFAVEEYIPPYEIQGNPFCDRESASAVSARFSLPPGAAMRIEMRPTQRNDLGVIFAGVALGEACPDSETRLPPANVWIYEGCSLTLLLIRYYLPILIALLFVTLAFLIYLLFRRSPAPPESKPASNPAAKI